MDRKKLIVVGGGAAGFFAAIAAAENSKALDILILEGSNKVLSKVLISGGGRCNVTNACLNPEELVGYYPRGYDKLLPAFEKFNCYHTIEWFESRGVPLKSEQDGRVFPTTDSSTTIASCLTRHAAGLGIKTLLSHRVISMEKVEKLWQVNTTAGRFTADYIVLATGGNAPIWEVLKGLHVEIVPPVPSLFTFNVSHPLFADLAGLSFDHATVKVVGTSICESGPLLITHKGLSGPVILKVSAWGAIELNKVGYQFEIEINWPGKMEAVVVEKIQGMQRQNPKQYVQKHGLFDVPKRMWIGLCEQVGIHNNRNWAEIGKKQIQALVKELCYFRCSVKGKSTFKEEFVTAGGIHVDEIDLLTFGVKKLEDFYAAGEVLNIDALTGGFNFQAAWTSGFLAGKSIAQNTSDRSNGSTP